MKPFLFELTQFTLLFCPLFYKVVWPSVQLLLAGAILAMSTLTIIAVLQAMGHSEEQQSRSSIASSTGLNGRHWGQAHTCC